MALAVITLSVELFVFQRLTVPLVGCIRTLATSTRPSTASPIADIVVHVHRQARSDRRARNDLQQTVSRLFTTQECVFDMFINDIPVLFTQEIGIISLVPEHSQRPECSAGLEVRYKAHHGAPRAYYNHCIQPSPIVLENCTTPNQ